MNKKVVLLAVLTMSVMVACYGVKKDVKDFNDVTTQKDITYETYSTEDLKKNQI